MSSLDYLDLCRLCLVKDRVSVPIFEGEGDVRQIFLKIASCLPVKVTREDKLPKKICDDCVYKVELFYQFWNTTANAEKQLLQWIGEVEMDEKPDYVTEVLNSEQTENRLEMMQSAEEQSNNIEINMMDGMGLGLPIIMSTNEQMSSDPITSSANVQSVQSVGSTTQAHSQLVQKDGTHEEEENTEDECDVDDGMHVKDENDSSVNDSRSMDTSYVSVPLDCDEAGPSGLQQQKLSDMTDMEMAQQSAEGDTKVGNINHSSKEVNCWIESSNIKKTFETKEMCKCDTCGYKCRKESTLNSHKRNHQLKEYQKEFFVCNECNFKFNKKTSLYSHIRKKHKFLQENPLMYTCSQCGYKNKNKYDLRVHIMRKHTEDYNYSCDTCNKKFKIKSDLTNHIRFSHREHPLLCDVCGKTCLNSNSLYVHQKFAHYKAKFECKICKRRMVSQENLNEHMLRQHEKRQNFICDECGKTFSRNNRLTMHMRIHTGDKPYTCTICNKSFARNASLKQHLLIHTGIRPYVCDICGKAFAQKPGLITHRKCHPGNHPPLPRVIIDPILNDVMNN